MLTDKSFDTGTTTIHYVEGPANGRPLILLHGITMRWQTFLTVLPAFSLRYHTYAIDLRGHGESGHIPGAYQIADYAEDVIHFLREEVREPAVLVGLSLGGNTAIQVAASAPDLTYAVVLEEPALYFAPKERFEKHPFYQILCTVHEFLNARPSRNAVKSKVQTIFPTADQVSIAANAKAWSQMDADALGQLILHRTHEHFRLDELLPKISCPLLLLQGTSELGAQLEETDVELVTSLLAQCTYVRVQGAGHNIHYPQAATYYQLVSHFLETF